jgi:hypothetical protein
MDGSIARKRLRIRDSCFQPTGSNRRADREEFIAILEFLMGAREGG